MVNSFSKVDLTSSDEIHSLSILAEKVFSDIKSDYFREFEISDFYKDRVEHISRVVKCASYRFLNKNLVDKFKALTQKFFNEKTYFHPVFYLRYVRNDIVNNNVASILDGQPHYDRSFGINASTFWVPLSNIDCDSGGICFFNETKTISEVFSFNSKRNAFDMNGYLRNFEELDLILRDDIIFPECELGDAITFGSDTLHGARRGVDRKRVSFDFRVITESNFRCLNSNLQKFIIELNENFDFFMICCLLNLGDVKGASRRLTQQYEDEVRDRFPFLIVNDGFDNYSDLPKNIHWKEEYSWIDYELFET